jgi:hypothetical protein
MMDVLNVRSLRLTMNCTAETFSVVRRHQVMGRHRHGNNCSLKSELAEPGELSIGKRRASVPDSQVIYHDLIGVKFTSAKANEAVTATAVPNVANNFGTLSDLSRHCWTCNVRLFIYYT